jgi:hypothetical protein
MGSDTETGWGNGGVSLSQYATAALDFDASKDSQLSIEELSTQIITDLLDSGVFDHYAHVIFIAHSMGGIIIKRVMIASAFDPRWQKIVERTSGIIFISVPSKGAEAANFVSKLPTMLTGRLVLDLRTVDTNTFLASQENLWWSFLRRPLRPLVFCAYEKKSTLGITVVPAIYTDTQCDDLPRAENEDHTSIVKPASTDADIYRWVRGRIFEITSTFKPTRAALDDPQAPLPTLYIKRIFNAPEGPAAINTTVWIGSTGQKKIILDAAHITHHPSNFVSGFSGAIEPVANPHSPDEAAILSALGAVLG